MSKVWFAPMKIAAAPFTGVERGAPFPLTNLPPGTPSSGPSSTKPSSGQTGLVSGRTGRDSESRSGQTQKLPKSRGSTDAFDATGGKKLPFPQDVTRPRQKAAGLGQAIDRAAGVAQIATMAQPLISPLISEAKELISPDTRRHDLEKAMLMQQIASRESASEEPKTMVPMKAANWGTAMKALDTAGNLAVIAPFAMAAGRKAMDWYDAPAREADEERRRLLYLIAQQESAQPKVSGILTTPVQVLGGAVDETLNVAEDEVYRGRKERLHQPVFAPLPRIN